MSREINEKTYDSLNFCLGNDRTSSCGCVRDMFYLVFRFVVINSVCFTCAGDSRIRVVLS
jgi:hypothetical protein